MYSRSIVLATDCPLFKFALRRCEGIELELYGMLPVNRARADMEDRHSGRRLSKSELPDSATRHVAEPSIPPSKSDIPYRDLVPAS